MKYKKILLVDDDLEDAEIFKMAVDAVDAKIKVSIQTNALTALNKLKQSDKFPDIIFLDYYMPYLDGSAFLKLLRQVEGLEKIPVVLYSGQSGSEVKDAGEKFNDVRFVKKKSSFRDIIDSLTEVLDSELIV